MARPKISAKKLHKYLGLPLCALLFFASLSGILLNHRDLLRQINVPRWLLPKSYSYANWNNGALRGAVTTSEGVFLYGTAGVWQTDSSLTTQPQDVRAGLAPGADEQRMMALVADSTERLWAISQFRLYQRPAKANRWQEVALPEELHGRLTDLQLRGDSLLLLSRSQLFLRQLGQTAWREIPLPAPEGYTGRLLVFQLLWALHSGEYLGLGGRLVVDAIGVLLLLLSLTGFAYTLFFSRLKRLKKRPSGAEAGEKRRQLAQGLATQDRWHRLLGRWFFWAICFVCVTGWTLRPPLMLPFIFMKARPLPGTALYSENPWFDRLRAIRYDQQAGQWLLATSEGFFTMPSLGDQPEHWQVQPPVSPMGINVFTQRPEGQWLIGSFSGLYEVTPQDSLPLRDYFSGESHRELKHVRPVTPHAVTGMILGTTASEDLVASYSEGIEVPASPSLPQPTEINDLSYSLWQYALEWHTGRLYRPLIGGLGVDLFIFLLGLATVLVLWSGKRRLKH